MSTVWKITDQVLLLFTYIRRKFAITYRRPVNLRNNGSIGSRLVSVRRALCKPDWVEHHISRPINRADGLMSRLPGGRRETTVLNDWRIESER